MQKALLIAEKPSLARDIEAVYKKTSGLSYEIVKFLPLRGHILNLAPPEAYKSEWGKPWNFNVLPMMPEKFKYQVREGCQDVFSEVKKEIVSGKYDFVINACDAGREGQAIFHTLYQFLGGKLPVKRFWASDTTPTSISKALKNLLDDEKDSALVNLKIASFYRAYFDWLIGMNLSRAITLKSKTLIPVGRVMTPTLAIVVERDLEIKNFVPVTYWEVEADFAHKYKGTWFDPKTEETRFYDKTKAEALIKSLGKSGEVVEVKKETEKLYAPTLHSLLELQKEANNIYGYSAQKTLSLAQSLYEKHKLLTYPRTESRCLSTAMVKEIPDHLKAVGEIPEVKPYVDRILADTTNLNNTLKSKKYVDNAKITDHHAIIPTTLKPDLTKLTKDEANLYMLVVRRFLAIFLPPCLSEKTTIVTKIGEEHFKTIGKVMVSLGWKELYKSLGNSNKDEDKDVLLPKVAQGDKYEVKAVDLKEKQTTPPAPYTDATLLQAMQNAGKFLTDKELAEVLKESAGLGTSATRDGIIEKLIKLNMLERKGKTIRATDFGIKVIQALGEKDITSPRLTAVWEKKLRDIEEGKMNPKAFYQEMLDYVAKETLTYVSMQDTGISKDNSLGKCPKCGNPVINGKNYYFCKNYKKFCDFIFGKDYFGTKISPSDAKKLIEGKTAKGLRLIQEGNGSFKLKKYIASTTKKRNFGR